MKIVAMVMLILLSVMPAFADDKGTINMDRKEIEGQLRQIWTAMSAKGLSGDIEGALDYFVDGAKDRYRKIFKEMSENKLKAVFSNISDFHLGSLSDRKAECGAIRIEGGKRYSYPVSFVRQDNGSWKIYGF